MSLTYQEAKERLAGMVALGEEPTLPDGSLDDLLRMARTIDRWGTAPDAFPIWTQKTYAVGDQVVPSNRGESAPTSWSSVNYIPPMVPFSAAVIWRVTVAGDSGADEPVWTTPVVPGVTTVVDGGVTWQAVGTTPWYGAWDLGLAACEGWRRKAALASSGYQFTDQSKTLMRNQIFDQCLKMAREYGKKTLRSASMSKGDVNYGRLIPGVETNWD